MNQATFHTEVNSTVRHLFTSTRMRLGAAMRAIKSFAAEMIIIGVMGLIGSGSLRQKLP